MENGITLKPMTAEMYHAFFREYENDRDLYLNPDDFKEYTYSREKVGFRLIAQDGERKHYRITRER